MTSKWPPLAPSPAPPGTAPSGVSLATPGASTHVTPTPPVAMGEVVAGKYRIDGIIGFGGMGIVCAATHLELGTPIAVKFVRAERATDDRAAARFLTEARAAAQLQSQFACRVMDCGRLPSGTPYIVMERLKGEDLRTLVNRRGPLPVEEAVTYALEACEALAEAHAKHIVHRDIKPENLFVTEGPGAAPLLKVLDFGISKQLGPLNQNRVLTEPTENMGSPFHMSPEQMIDPAGVDWRTDIWSLGVVLYEVLTGQLPFSGETTPQLCANVMTTQPIPPLAHRDDIPEDLSRVILRCLEKDRARRYADVAELGLALRPFGGAASQLAAARVERILGRTPTPMAAAVSSPDLAEEEERELESSGSVAVIPGVPRRGSGWRFGVGLVLLVASALSALALWRAFGRSEPTPEPLPNNTATVPSAEPSTTVSATPSASSATPPKPKPRVVRSATPTPSAAAAPPTVPEITPPAEPPAATPTPPEPALPAPKLPPLGPAPPGP